MDLSCVASEFWRDVAAQDRERLPTHFLPDAVITWPNTNEHFSVADFIRANCEYPGSWCADVVRMETSADLVITVTRVWHKQTGHSFHVVSFFKFREGKIALLHEYWGDDGPPPKWRIELLAKGE